MDLPPRNILSLCSGLDGIGLGLGLAFPEARVVCHVEIEAFTVAVLQARMEEGSLVPSPVFTDLRSFDGRRWRGAVDTVIAGIPCQGNSIAGKRRLERDPRDLWGETRRILREVAPRWFVLENVSGFLVPGTRDGLSAPAARVLGELAEDGWDAEWCLLPASACGASHQRNRFFLLARRQLDDTDKQGSQGRREGGSENRGERGVYRTPGLSGTTGGEPVADDPGERERTPDDDQCAVAPGRKPRRNSGRGGVRSGEPLGNAGGECDQRRRKPRDVPREAGATEEDSEQRQRGGDTADGDVGRAIIPLGHTDTEGPQGRSVPECGGSHGFPAQQGSRANGPGRGVCQADADRAGRNGEGLHLSERRPQQAVPDADWAGGRIAEGSLSVGTGGLAITGLDNGQPGGDIPLAGLPLFPPGPGRRDLWRDILHDHPGLAPALEPEETQSALRLVADGPSPALDLSPSGAGREGEDGGMEGANEAGTDAVDWPRIDALRSLGNACLPLQCAVAVTILYRRFREDSE